MIKLIVNPESNPTTHLYNKPVVIIGAAPSPEIDLTLQGLNLQRNHLKIVQEGQLFFIVNLANDPFVTLNGMPFGKKLLNNQDIIQIGQTLISFEGKIIPEMSESKLDKATPRMQEPIKAPPQQETTVYADFDLEQELRALSTEGWEDLEENEYDLKDLMGEIDTLSPIEEFIKEPTATAENQMQPPVSPVAFPGPSSWAKTNKPKVYQSEEFDDETDNWKKPAPETPKKATTGPKAAVDPFLNRDWKNLFLIAISFMALVGVILAVVFLRISYTTKIDEMKAAEGVSDVAMALTYAQINHINPQTQNWSDPEFLKNNLAAIIASDYLSFANIDTHGHFKDANYILRIYTNSDFSRFLVMALPGPSVLQWLIPKSAIIVDSDAMELRKIHDLRILNRLLINSNPLDGSNGTEISNLLKKGSLVHLSVIAAKAGEKAFSPPKALKLVRPGAENLIYNAPRYYQFGESYMKRAINLAKSPEGASHELSRLQHEMRRMSDLPNLVLYSSEGMEAAIQAQKALTTFVPEGKFINAYLKFDQEGNITSSHLLMEEDPSAKPFEVNTQVVLHSLHPDIAALIKHKSENIIAEARPTPTRGQEIDENNPLLFQLKALSAERKKALQHISELMISAIIGHTEDYSKDFEADFGGLYAQYIQIDHQERAKIMQGLSELYEEYSFMPLAELLPYGQAAGLEKLVEETIKARSISHGNDDPAAHEQIEIMFQNIKRAQNFEGLAYYVSEVSPLLTLKYISLPELVINYQNQLHTLVSRKLAFFILSADSPLPASEFNERNRSFLTTILEKAWIASPEEFEFYLSEFDLLLRSHIKGPNL